MRWVYILQCKEGYYYVGETSRLYRRFWEHIDGKGCVNTSTLGVENIVALYKLDSIGKFFHYHENVINNIYDKWLLKYFSENTYEYDNLIVENYVAEWMMINTKDWQKIRGGKYTRFINYKYPTNIYVKDLPVCRCGLPCDVKKNEDKNHLYFRCAKKNMWDDFREIFDIEDEPCNFYLEYINDKQFRYEEEKKFEERRLKLKTLFRKSSWLKNILDYCGPCICCKRQNYNKVKYFNKEKNLCFDCFIEKNDELCAEYDVSHIENLSI